MFQRDKEEIVTADYSQGKIDLTYFANQRFYNTDVAERDLTAEIKMKRSLLVQVFHACGI